MAKFRFIGDPRDGGGPAVYHRAGIDFPKGKPVDVPDDVAAKLATHSHFEEVKPGRRPRVSDDQEQHRNLPSGA